MRRGAHNLAPLNPSEPRESLTERLDRSKDTAYSTGNGNYRRLDAVPRFDLHVRGGVKAQEHLGHAPKYPRLVYRFLRQNHERPGQPARRCDISESHARYCQNQHQ
ncbi:hypothetical protein JXD38_03845 [candidate division WOR-3 bacterium]|nr:hypothetical protein [candidate division WOR-3 bacterium]